MIHIASMTNIMGEVCHKDLSNRSKDTKTDFLAYNSEGSFIRKLCTFEIVLKYLSILAPSPVLYRTIFVAKVSYTVYFLNYTRAYIYRKAIHFPYYPKQNMKNTLKPRCINIGVCDGLL